MSTIGYDSWAVDLAEVGAIYPFQGYEGLMVILGLAFWIGWHIVQFRSESKHLDKVAKLGDPDKIAKAMDRY
ncbi:MAG: hypothetical protein WBB85_13815 [Albidovulum sp.]|uniref:hypothetical protein n=1 Tax=Albidovulum sp. TaxID=1872424 RepID=UPI003CACB1CC